MDGAIARPGAALSNAVHVRHEIALHAPAIFGRLIVRHPN